jgi:cyclophilin family peptidyl-prolyl cis-trans isomerase
MKISKKTIFAILISIALVIVIVGFLNQTDNQEETPFAPEKTANVQEEKKEEAMIVKDNQPPEMQIDQAKAYQAVLTTSAGKITIKLFADKTPITVNNFVYLSQKGFYNQTIFHRVIEDFMIQGGDPEGTGRGGPGYKFDDEPFEGEYKRGIVAMANAGPNTNGSQFFIIHQDYQLPPNYVIFGEVVKGLEVVDKIATAPVKPGGEGSSPVNPVSIESVEILIE